MHGSGLLGLDEMLVPPIARGLRERAHELWAVSGSSNREAPF